MSAFISMNGYGFYIWSAYGVTALVVIVELLSLRSRRRAALADAELAAPDAELAAPDPAREPTEAAE